VRIGARYLLDLAATAIKSVFIAVFAALICDNRVAAYVFAGVVAGAGPDCDAGARGCQETLTSPLRKVWQAIR
jgi:hypothetical protein